MTRAQKISFRLRWFLRVLWVLCFACGVLWVIAGTLFEKLGVGLLGTPLFFLGPLLPLLEDSGLLGRILCVIIYLGVFLMTQWLFLCPRSVWKMKLEPSGRPMKSAAIGVGFAVMLLSVGLLYSVLDLVSPVGKSEGIGMWNWLFLLIPLILWCFWSVIFWVYWRRGDYYTWTSRVIRGLIAGSVLELFVAVPINATRQDECYCARGSYAGLIFGTTVLLWAFGPGVFLLFIEEKHRREKLLDKI
ncbi:MAG: hypothetical protein MUP16_12605 [Sedimentisphaerales bacterium]|nr:hypothetical protein [Sedimentisphaerales bacterium]